MNSILALFLTFSLFTAPTPQLHPVIYRPVSLSQVVAFLNWDDTDQHSYQSARIVDGVVVPGFYCGDFAELLTRNARFSGIDAHSVGILFTHTAGHAIVSFETTDAGTIYVEPQTDDLYFDVEVGKPLCTADLNLCIGNMEPIREIITN
ncbi:MAG: hypothetical protein ABSG01_09095 [Anaerolineales bacterium]|jgi:hypothetical protein